MTLTTRRITSGRAPAVGAPARPERLTPDDDLFVRMEHALGVPVVNQCVWRLGPDVDEAFVADLARRLAHGRFGRTVIRRRLPVRDRWMHTPDAGTHHFDDARVAAADSVAWAREQVEAGVDSVAGPSWRLSAARCADTDETLVSLIISHAVADGGAVITGLEEAVDEVPYDTTNPPVSRRDGLRDGADLIRTAGAAAWRLARGGASQPASAPTPTAPSTPDSSSSAAPQSNTAIAGTPSTIIAVDDTAFLHAATAAHGTPNSLFAAIALGILADTGRVRTGDVVPISLPMSTRVPGDRRANATSGVSAKVTVTEDRYRDLTPIRTASKDAYRGLADGPGPMALMGRALQPFGDGLVRRIASDMPGPLCLASNLGDLSTAMATLGSARPGPVAMRSVMPTSAASAAADLDGGISAWCSRSAGRMTICLTSLDHTRVADDAALAALAIEELRRWGLSGKTWGA